MPRHAAPLTHSPVHLSEPEDWVFFASHSQPTRLAVFVHGFKGKNLATWGDFPYSGSSSAWVRETDMLFVGYPSTKEAVSASEYRIRKWLPKFFPAPPPTALSINGIDCRPILDNPYRELVLIGHSLGGLVLRRALTEIATICLQGQGATEEPLLSGRLRLFSPATAGFRPSGHLGRLLSIPPAELTLYIALRGSPAFRDLEQGSPLIVNTQRRTEKLASEHPGFSALRAEIVWANPENIICSEHYDTDPAPYAVDGKNHVNVCKPQRGYTAPLEFVELGRLQ